MELFFLQRAATTLVLSDRTLSTSSMYAGDNCVPHLAVCTFLAAKTCEEWRRVRDVLNALEVSVGPCDTVHSCTEHWARKERLVLGEQRLLRSIGHATMPPDAQVLLLNILHKFGASSALSEVCIALLNDTSTHSGIPSLVAVSAAATLGARALDLSMPASWKIVLEVDTNPLALSATCHMMLDAYDPLLPRHNS